MVAPGKGAGIFSTINIVIAGITVAIVVTAELAKRKKKRKKKKESK